MKRPPSVEPAFLPEDALPQLLDTVLRLPLLDAAQLKELIQRLPNPEAAAQEMLRRGWITQEQFSSLFPGPEQRPTLRDTMLLGCGDDESPLDADGEDWSLPLGDGEDAADAPSEIERARPDRSEEKPRPKPQTVEAVPVLSGAQWKGWLSKALLTTTLFLTSLFAGAQFFQVNSIAPQLAHQQLREVHAGDPSQVVDLVPLPRNDLLNNPVPTAKSAEAPAQQILVKPQSTASLYDRVRRVVLENKTEETQRLGIGDIAYQNVPRNGSIMVGMEVTYAPFFTHQIIKSVRPIYQGPDGGRYVGPVCGNPTGIRDRVVAREGYAIGAAAIRAGMGIDGMQLTFMEIGADGLNPNKTYLSKWLGGYGGSDATTFVNDGRPIVGIAGMRSKDPNGPAFCLCLVTTRAGTLPDAAGPSSPPSPINKTMVREDLRNGIGPNGQPTAPAVGPLAAPPSVPKRLLKPSPEATPQ